MTDRGRDDVVSPADSPLFESLPNPVLAYACEDGTAVVRATNATFREVFDYSRDDIIGRPVADLARAVEAAEIAPNEFATRLTEGTPFKALVQRTKDGTDRYFVCRPGHPDEPTDGHIDGLLEYTEITELEEERRALVDRVERVESFTDIVAHDLRNPIEVAQIRIDAAEDTGEAIHFEKARNAVQRMDDIIATVRSMTLDAEQLTTEWVTFSDVVESAWGNVDTGAATLVNEAAETLSIRADPKQLQQLLENLLRNSVTHGTANVAASASDDAVGAASPNSPAAGQTHSAGLTIRVGTINAADGGLRGFYVADTGTGFSSAVRDRMFDPGYSSTADGTGYGLAIVQRIANAHGWNVTATTSDEGGARFEFGGVEWSASD